MAPLTILPLEVKSVQKSFSKTLAKSKMEFSYDPLKHKRLFLLGLLSEPKIEISIHVRKHGNCLEIVKLIVYDQKYFMFDSSRDIKEAVMDFQITTKIFFLSNIFASYSANVCNFFYYLLLENCYVTMCSIFKRIWKASRKGQTHRNYKVTNNRYGISV